MGRTKRGDERGESGVVWLRIYAGDKDYTEDGEVIYVDLSSVHKVYIQKIEAFCIGEKDYYTVNVVATDGYDGLTCCAVKDFKTRADAENYAEKLIKVCALSPMTEDLYFVEVENIERTTVKYEDEGE